MTTASSGWVQWRAGKWSPAVRKIHAAMADSGAPYWYVVGAQSSVEAMDAALSTVQHSSEVVEEGQPPFESAKQAPGPAPAACDGEGEEPVGGVCAGGPRGMVGPEQRARPRNPCAGRSAGARTLGGSSSASPRPRAVPPCLEPL